MLFIVFFTGYLSLILGVILSCFIKKTAKNFIIGLGFSAGIMLYMSLNGSLDKSNYLLEKIYISNQANLYTTLLFCIGLFLTLIIDVIINQIPLTKTNTKINTLLIDKVDFIKMFLFMLIAIMIHNIPEGLYTIYRLKNDFDNFYILILPLLLHNLLEGLALGFPLNYIINDYHKTITLTAIFSIVSLIFIFVFFSIFKGLLNTIILAFFMVFSSALMLYVIFNYILSFSQRYTIGYYIVFIGVVLGLLSMMLIVDIIPFLVNIIL